MHKVIKLDGETIYVGKQGGDYTAIPREQFGFEPQLGDNVEFYKNGDEYIVSKVDPIANFAGTQSGKSTKSKLVAGLLALFLPPFYYFYIGNIGMGIFRMIVGVAVLIPFLGQVLFLPLNVIWWIVLAILVFASKPGSKYHKDAQGLELLD